MSDFFCTLGCKVPKECQHRRDGDCAYEYDASKYPPHHRWRGEGPPPRTWYAGGSVVYRSFADSCD